MSKPRIAIPIPTSFDFGYNHACWPQYARAIEAAGGEPVSIELTLPPQEVVRLAGSCSSILLPGSPADVNPQKYGHTMEPGTSAPDPQRENVDELLLQDAHNLYKPIFGICYGLQSMNIWRGGTLVQDLSVMPVNHGAGPSVAVAHTTTVETHSALHSLLQGSGELDAASRLPINSSHHQAVGIVGDGLRVAARCPQDGVVEALEATAPDHFVLGVQWHPERSTEISGASRALFSRFFEASAAWTPRAVTTSVL